MMLVVAALMEELEVAMGLCEDRRRIRNPVGRAWRAKFNGRDLCFLKIGVGPLRAEGRLQKFLDLEHPTNILLIGYAGALDPSLRVGDLVAASKATWIEAEEGWGEWKGVGTWDIDPAISQPTSILPAGIRLRSGEALTSAHIIGDPALKKVLYQRFHAAIVDMESAAVARVAAIRKLPLTCVRVISDEATDEFLTPFSYDPSAGVGGRIGRIVTAGNWVSRYSQWRERATRARESLRRFMLWYFESGTTHV